MGKMAAIPNRWGNPCFLPRPILDPQPCNGGVMRNCSGSSSTAFGVRACRASEKYNLTTPFGMLSTTSGAWGQLLVICHRPSDFGRASAVSSSQMKLTRRLAWLDATICDDAFATAAIISPKLGVIRCKMGQAPGLRQAPKSPDAEPFARLRENGPRSSRTKGTHVCAERAPINEIKQNYLNSLAVTLAWS
jgi:hypothetical protein